MCVYVYNFIYIRMSIIYISNEILKKLVSKSSVKNATWCTRAYLFSFFFRKPDHESLKLLLKFYF